MNKRSRLAALMGAGVLTFAAVGAVLAAPTYHITVTKTADPTSVPAGGGDVTFTVHVAADQGTAFFQGVNVSDSLVGCTLGAPTGDDGDGKLEDGETWNYSCTVHVTPGTTNTATVNACHDGSSGQCNNSNHNASGSGEVTVTLSNGNPGTSPGASGQPSTDTLVPTGESGPANAAWLIIAALGVLLGSIVVLSPARIGRRR